MLPHDRANLDALVRMAGRDSKNTWPLLEWLGVHGMTATLRWAPRAQLWACEWEEGGVGSLTGGASSPVAHHAVIECGKTILEGTA
jgi:hypothetical protein